MTRSIAPPPQPSGPPRQPRAFAGYAVRRLARGLRRVVGMARRMRPLTVLALAMLLALLGTAVWRNRQSPPADLSGGSVVRVGVHDGDSIPAYVAASASRLHALTPAASGRKVYALVSLDRYLPPDRLTPLISRVELAVAYARVPLPHRQTEIVHLPAFTVADVSAGMTGTAGRKVAEAADDLRLAAAVTGDGAAARDQREIYRTGAQVATAEADAYRAHCACVYALVVRATPAALTGLAALADVRAVDPAPQVVQLDRAVFLPPLPEQTGIVHPPPDR